MKAVLFSLLATVVGVAMVAGGIWGLIDAGGDNDGERSSSLLAPVSAAPTSSPRECARVAERDGRFLLPHDLLFGGNGRATVQCRGGALTFSIELSGVKSGTFYDVVLERGRREESVGTLLATAEKVSTTVTVSPEVDTSRYDFLTVREADFGAGTAAEKDPAELDGPFRAAL